MASPARSATSRCGRSTASECRCGGRGCLETLAGQEAIARRVGIQGTRSETSSPAELVAEFARERAIPAVIARARRGRRVPRHLHRRGGLARQPAARRPGRHARDARALAPARRARRRGPAHDGRSDGRRDRRFAARRRGSYQRGRCARLTRRAERSDAAPRYAPWRTDSTIGGEAGRISCGIRLISIRTAPYRSAPPAHQTLHAPTKGTGVKKLIPAIGLALVAIAGTATTVAQGKTSSSKAGADSVRPAARPEVVGAVGDAGSPGFRRRFQEGRRHLRDQQRQR